MPVFLDNTLVVLFLSILRMLRDGSLMSCILKEPLPEREILVHFLALVTTMVTKVDHSNHRSNDHSNHCGQGGKGDLT